MLKQFLIILLVWYTVTAFSQATPDTPVEYMNYFTVRDRDLSQKYMSYVSEMAHGNRARKMERRRQELINEIRQSLTEATRLRPFKGDASLRDAYKRYWDILLKVFNEDYHKIVNMEEIAEQSYDNMEAYMLAQDKASEVLSAASSQIPPVYRAFAANNNVRLSDDGVESKMDKKLRQVAKVNQYYRPLYLIFFKSYKQEMYVLDAYKRKDINSIEQNKNTLIRFAEEGLAKIDTIKPFGSDGSMITACRKVLEFHKNEAEKFVPGMSDFLLKNDEFEKMKKAFDAKPASKRTQADIDQYNKYVHEINDAMNKVNKDLTSLDSNRQRVMDNWNITKSRFMDYHVPKG